MKPRTYIILLLAACCLTGCSIAGRLTRKGAGAELAYIHKPLQVRSTPDSTAVGSSRRDASKRTDLLQPATLSTVDGEQMLTIDIEEVVVVAPSRTLPERMGEVEVDFTITLPRELQGSSRSILITPVLHCTQQSQPLQQITVRGAFFDKVQRRDYWQYGRYIQLYTPDSVRAAWAFDRFVRYPHLQGVRRDSITSHSDEVSFHYTQQVPTASVGKKLKITLEGQVVGLDGTRYLLPPSDTLTFNISSMLTFVDETPRYVKHIISRYAQVSDRNTLSFRAADTRIIDTLADNERQLALIHDLMQSIVTDKEFITDSIIISCSSSPDGKASTNLALSLARGQALRHRLTEQFPDAGPDTLFRVKAIGEDWSRLSHMISDDPHIANTEAIQKIISTQPDHDRREAMIRARYAEDYNYIRRRLYPELRTVTFGYYLHRPNMTQDTIVTSLPDTLYQQGRDLLNERRYGEAYAILRAYADRNTAICLLSLGRDDAALDVLIGLEDDAPVWYLRAIACARQGMTEQALEAYDNACALDENMQYRAALDPELNQLIKNR